LSAVASGSGAAFDRWFDRFFGDDLKRRPVDATFLGVHDHDHALPDYSLEADTDLLATSRDLIAQLDAIPFDGLTQTQLFDRALARGALELRLWETGSRFFQAGNPAHHTSAAVFGVSALFQRDSDPLAERVDAAIGRMRALPTMLATARTRVVRAPLVWTERAIREADAGVVYFDHGIRLLAEERGIAQEDFFRQATVAAQAFRDHAAWLRAVLAERRIPFRPAGTDAFDRYLRLGYLLPADQTAEWWFDYAHAELIETTRDLRELAAAIDWKRSSRQQLVGLAEHHPSPDRYYPAFGTAWNRFRQLAIDTDLVTWPDARVDFVPIPPSDRAVARGLVYPTYGGSPPFGDRASDRVFIPSLESEMPPEAQRAVLRDTNDTRIALDYAIRQGGLGHHVQNFHALRAESRIGRMAGVMGASRLAMFCAGTLVDGWAAYATELMEEIGALTPVQRLAEAQFRMRIAARAVADTAIHSGEFGWERAARFLRDEAGMPASTALAEVVQISMFPGRGMAALAGVAAIDELRRHIEDSEGPAFTLRSFHDRLLSYGALPMNLIAAAMLAETESKVQSPVSREMDV